MTKQANTEVVARLQRSHAAVADIREEKAAEVAAALLQRERAAQAEQVAKDIQADKDAERLLRFKTQAGAVANILFRSEGADGELLRGHRWESEIRVGTVSTSSYVQGTFQAVTGPSVSAVGALRGFLFKKPHPAVVKHLEFRIRKTAWAKWRMLTVQLRLAAYVRAAFAAAVANRHTGLSLAWRHAAALECERAERTDEQNAARGETRLLQHRIDHLQMTGRKLDEHLAALEAERGFFFQYLRACRRRTPRTRADLKVLKDASCRDLSDATLRFDLALGVCRRRAPKSCQK